MSKMLFMSDNVLVSGIYDLPNEKKVSIDEQCENIASNINEIRKKLNIDECIFSIYSDNESEYFRLFLKNIEPFLEKYNIVLGRQFVGSLYYDDKEYEHENKKYKPYKIIDYIKSLNTNDELKWVGYANNDYSYALYSIDEIKKSLVNIESHFFLVDSVINDTGINATQTIKGGLVGLNDTLRYYLEPSLVINEGFDKVKNIGPLYKVKIRKR